MLEPTPHEADFGAEKPTKRYAALLGKNEAFSK